MALIRKRFPLDRPVLLPADTVVLEPVAAAPFDRQSSGLLPLGDASEIPGRCGIARAANPLHRSHCTRKLLAVSASKGSFIVVEAGLRRAFEILLGRGTLRQALAAAKRAFPRDARSRMRDLLTDVEMMRFYEHAVPKEVVPGGASLQFYVTNACNLRCRHCYMSSGMPMSPRELSPAERLRVIDLFARVYPGGTVTFTGGEPLVCPDIFNLTGHAFECGLTVQLFTNGLLIDTANLARLMKHVHLVQISLDGATAATHDAIRGRGTFRRVLRSIRLLDLASTAHKRFSYRIAVTLTGSNQADLATNFPRLLRHLSLGGRFVIAIGSLSRMGRAATEPASPSSFDEMTNAQLDLIDRLTRAGVYRAPSTPANVFTRTCGFGAAVTVAADGSLYPCSITDQPPLGNVRDADAERIMAAVREHVEAANVDRVRGCQECPIRYFCGGLCRIVNLDRTGSYTTSACTDEYRNYKIRALMRTFQSARVSAGLA